MPYSLIEGAEEKAMSGPAYPGRALIMFILDLIACLICAPANIFAYRAMKELSSSPLQTWCAVAAYIGALLIFAGLPGNILLLCRIGFGAAVNQVNLWGSFLVLVAQGFWALDFVGHRWGEWSSNTVLISGVVIGLLVVFGVRALWFKLLWAAIEAHKNWDEQANGPG